MSLEDSIEQVLRKALDQARKEFENILRTFARSLQRWLDRNWSTLHLGQWRRSFDRFVRDWELDGLNIEPQSYDELVAWLQAWEQHQKGMQYPTPLTSYSTESSRFSGAESGVKGAVRHRRIGAEFELAAVMDDEAAKPSKLGGFAAGANQDADKAPAANVRHNAKTEVAERRKHALAVEFIKQHPTDLKPAIVDTWVRDAIAVRSSDPRYVMLREEVDESIVDYLLEKSRSRGGWPVYRVVLVHGHGEVNKLRGRGVDIHQLIAEGRTVSTADMFVKKYAEQIEAEKTAFNPDHLTYAKALQLSLAITMLWRLGSKAYNAGNPLTRRFLMRYVDKTGGTERLTYADLTPRPEQVEALQLNARMAVLEMLAKNLDKHLRQATFKRGDQFTALHGFPLIYRMAKKVATLENGTKHLKGTIVVTLTDTYDFDGATGDAEYFPFLSASTFGTWPTDNIRDRWMWDLEQYGLARRFNISAEWSIMFDAELDSSGKPREPISIDIP